MTFGELRYAARKLVLKLDPDAARKRKEAAKREAHVRRFREESGNAGMVARELPSDEVLASWQHVEQRALDLRAAGVPGTLQDLRVRAYLDLLQERDSRAAPAGPVPAEADPGPAAPGHRPTRPARPPAPEVLTDPAAARAARAVPAPLPVPDPDAGPSLAALVTITIPLTTYQGRSDTPGEADGYGLLDGDDARDLAAAAARHPRTRWCVTALNPDGTAAAHACLPGRQPPRGTGPPGRHPPRHRPPAPAPGHPHHPADPRHPRSLRPRPRRDRLPAQPQTPAPGPRPQRPVHRPGLRPARRPLRPGPYRPLGPGRHHLRMRSRPAMSSSP